MDALAIIAVVNVVLWGGAFVLLWWMTRAETELEAEIDALEKWLEGED